PPVISKAPAAAIIPPTTDHYLSDTPLAASGHGRLSARVRTRVHNLQGADRDAGVRLRRAAWQLPIGELMTPSGVVLGREHPHHRIVGIRRCEVGVHGVDHPETAVPKDLCQLDGVHTTP